jgi:hypothetical protein
VGPLNRGRASTGQKVGQARNRHPGKPRVAKWRDGSRVVSAQGGPPAEHPLDYSINSFADFYNCKQGVFNRRPTSSPRRRLSRLCTSRFSSPERSWRRREPSAALETADARAFNQAAGRTRSGACRGRRRRGARQRGRRRRQAPQHRSSSPARARSSPPARQGRHSPERPAQRRR